MRTVEWHAGNGDILYFTQAKPFLMNKLYPGVPSGAAEKSRGIRCDGQNTHNVTVEPLTPILTGSVHGLTPKELDELKMRMQAAFNPKKRGLLIYNTNAGSFRLECRAIAGATFDRQLGNSQNFTVDFEADDAFWTYKNLDKLSIGDHIKMWRFPWVIKPTVFGRIINRGLVNNTSGMDIYPKIIVSSTESSRITLGNLTTGAITTINKSIEAGAHIEFDMKAPSVRLFGRQSGIWRDEDIWNDNNIWFDEPTKEEIDDENVTHWITIDSVFPWACVEGVNEIYCDVDDPSLSPIIVLEWYIPVGGLD